MFFCIEARWTAIRTYLLIKYGLINHFFSVGMIYVCFSYLCCCCSVTKSYSNLLTPWLQLARLSCPSLTPGVCSVSCLLSWWCYLTISLSATPFSLYLQSFPASGAFPMRQFTKPNQSIGASTSASILPMNIQGWFPLGLTGLISFQSKRLLKVFSSTTIPKYQFFSIQSSLWSNSHICTWLLQNHSFDYMDICQQSDVSDFKYAI